MATASSPHVARRWTYDVFVSFRGKDTRKTFIGHLFKDFKRKGIRHFEDDEDLERGEDLSPELYKAIEQSRILIVVFSKNYASSAWCLKELVKILECKGSDEVVLKDKREYKVRPIFYDVKPDVVRKQTESYAESLKKHADANRTEVPEWKEALTTAANLGGWDLEDSTNGDEPSFIDMITKEVFKILSRGPLHIGENLVGLDSRVKEMNLKRFIVSNEKVHMIGVCGAGGVGKTTISRAIYNLLHVHFEHSSFCEDVKGTSKREGLAYLQKQLIEDITGRPESEIRGIAEGVERIKQIMGSRKVLVVLDNVDNHDQLDNLAAMPNWFAPGSMIVINGRDKQLLQLYGVEIFYKVDHLRKDEALELFSLYAFRNEKPQEDFIQLANRVIDYVKGHPLALKVLGSSLFCKTLREWDSELDKLHQVPNIKIHEVLKLSYDGLDDCQKSVFLDIACFFAGETKDFVTKILDACDCFPNINIGCHPDSSIRALVDKSLIMVENNNLMMHDLIRQMGREIVRRESEDPGKRSRLWFWKDASYVLNNKRGTEAVRGLVLDLASKDVNIDCKTFENLNNLRLLKLSYGETFKPLELIGRDDYEQLRHEGSKFDLSGVFVFLCNELRCLHWHGYPLESLPSAFYPKSLVSLDMSYSDIKQFPTGSKGLKRLAFLNLSHCLNLTRTPDFTEILNLEELILDGCINLLEVDRSIGVLENLKVLNLRKCPASLDVPTGSKGLKRLAFLNLSHCLNLTRTPDFTEFPNLEELILDGCINLIQVDESIGVLKNLNVLNLNGCKSLHALPELPSNLAKLLASEFPIPKATAWTRRFTYDVFVSFRGEDIRKSFMDHLFSDFRRKGIRAFKDDERLKGGEIISTELYKEIEQSRFLIVVFSKNYASSAWCLRELVKILDCKLEGKEEYEVRTIYYDVKPTVVWNQTESYAEGLRKHEAKNRKEVEEWKKALATAADLSGWDLQDSTNGYEAKFIDIITKDVFNTLMRGPLHIGQNLVGLHSRAEEMNLTQFLVSNEKVHMIGVCGPGGIGKTTISRAIYNLWHVHFEGSSFCEDVKGASKREGLVYIQKQLIEHITGAGELKIWSTGEGVALIKRIMGSKKVLVVLDNVDHHNQLDNLAGKPDWFGPGSMIVINGRDRHLLESYGVDVVYEVHYLSELEALELFSLYAFGNEPPQDNFIHLAIHVVHYVRGHPLALKVLGSSLFSKTLHVWESELDKLQQVPNIEIHTVLKLSYDGLDPIEKNVFLDIACFFAGEIEYFVTKLLDACECFPESSISALVDKSLITLEKDKLMMHDLIQQMGWQIVREESEDPGKRSRLWFSEDVSYVLNNKRGTEAIRGLVLDLSSEEEEVNVDCKTFENLINLRLLKLSYGQSFKPLRPIGRDDYEQLKHEGCKFDLSGGFVFLSNELRCLHWHGYPLESLPSAFYPESLVSLDMSYSNIKQLPTGSKGLKRLTFLNLSHCLNLTRTPDFTEIPNLEELILDGCINLLEVIGVLNNLKVLNLRNCKSLRGFSTTEFKNLETLAAPGCSNVDKLLERFVERNDSILELDEEDEVEDNLVPIKKKQKTGAEEP